MDEESLKKAVGYKAADFIESGMIVGLGTGSTAKYFIEKLIERKNSESLKIHVVASSLRSLEQAEKGGLPILDINTVTSVDITVDGADEIDAQKRMIKGGGGALLREKIVAAASARMVVIADESKWVKTLGRFPLPIEVMPFGWTATRRAVEAAAQAAGSPGPTKLRQGKDGHALVTDGGH